MERYATMIMIRTVRETNDRAVNIKKGFDEGGIEDKRESRTECGVLARNECMRGVQKRVTFENGLHMAGHQCAKREGEGEDHRVLNGLFSLYYCYNTHTKTVPSEHDDL